MSTRTSQLQIGSIPVLVVRKPIKNVHLSVLPPDGKVRVSTPLHLSDDAIRTLVATRLRWIRKHQESLSGQAREAPREYVSGESHYLFGRRYRLELIVDDGPARVVLKSKTRMVLYAGPRSTIRQRERAVREWYRVQLRPVVADLVDRWSERIGVRPTSWGIKRMKTRWGTCNHEAGRIWLNLELAKKPPRCVEYVVVHELLHLIEKRHNELFLDLLTDFLPRWRDAKDELNRFILAPEKWNH